MSDPKWEAWLKGRLARCKPQIQRAPAKRTYPRRNITGPLAAWTIRKDWADAVESLKGKLVPVRFHTGRVGGIPIMWRWVGR